MAIPAYTKQLVALARAQGFNVQLLEVPPDRVYVIRDIVIRLSLEADVANLYYKTPGNSFISVLYLSGLASQTFHQELRQALRPGDQLWLQTTGSGDMTLAITGYDLSESGEL